MKKIFILILAPFLFHTHLNSGNDGWVLVEKKESYKNYLIEKEKEKMRAEFEVRKMITKLIIIRIESNFDVNAFNPSEDAVGLFQIRPVMVREINRLLKEEKYSLEDRYSITRSIEMFVDYNNVVNPEWDYEKSARMWNGGITGMKKSSTDVYWAKFLSYLSGS